jgi:hypothetical protein
MSSPNQQYKDEYAHERNMFLKVSIEKAKSSLYKTSDWINTLERHCIFNKINKCIHINTSMHASMHINLSLEWKLYLVSLASFPIQPTFTAQISHGIMKLC